MTRSVPEWKGSTDDAMPPPRVRLRIFNRHEGICHISKRKIAAGERWQLDHIVALIDGGANVESNLAPALTEPHKQKTKQEVSRKAKIDAIAKRNLGIKSEKKRTIQSPGFPKKAKPEKLPMPARISLFQDVPHDR